MTYYESSGMLNSTNSTQLTVINYQSVIEHIIIVQSSDILLDVLMRGVL